MDFTKLQQDLAEILEEVKRTLQLPIDAKGNLQPGASLTLEDLEKLLSRTQGMVDQLNSRAEAVAKESGMTREEMAEKLKDPKNFSPEEWQTLQAMKKQVEQFQNMLKRTVVMQGDEKRISHERERLKQTGNPEILKQKSWMKL